MPTISETGIVRFGVFEVDRKTGELRRNGAKVKLQEQPLQVLLTLLERPRGPDHAGGVAQPAVGP